ncbi:hypothetical protein [Roseovarius faecimaris]|nr:hypothetical protein [Roseovarius faecimaris]
MTKQSLRRSGPSDTRPKRHVLLFLIVLMLSSGLMYLDMALRFRP